MEKRLFIRRCHICGLTLESLEDIVKCQFCAKPLLPFDYFERKKIREENGVEEPTIHNILGQGPILGLMVYW